MYIPLAVCIKSRKRFIKRRLFVGYNNFTTVLKNSSSSNFIAVEVIEQ